jgi:hypothetical protein
MSPAMRRAFERGDRINIRLRNVPKKSLGQRLRKSFDKKFFPKTRSKIRRAGGVVQMAKNALRDNALTRLPGKVRAARLQRAKVEIRKTLKRALSSAERKVSSIGAIVEMKALGNNRYGVKVVRLSKRSGGKTEWLLDVKLSYPGLLGSLGRSFGALPHVEIEGHHKGSPVFSQSVARMDMTESIIAGQQTMIGIGLPR